MNLTLQRCLSAIFSFFIICSSSLAVKTEQWELNTAQEFMRGKLNRVVVDNSGQLRLGYAGKRVGEFAKEVWCATTGRDGTIYFGTGSPADVYALGKDGQATRLFEAEAIAVTSLALDSRGNLYAGTFAEGKIYKLPADGKKEAAEFCKLRAPYVWSLVVDAQDRLYAGTGPDGKIYRIGADGKAEEWFAAEEANILCLAFTADGALLAGGSERGLLYRVNEKGKGVVLHEFAEDEVKALAVRGDRIYIGANKQKVRRPRTPEGRRPSAAEFEDLTRQLSSQFGGRVPADMMGRETPPEARLANLLSGTLYVRDADGRVDRLASWNDESVLDIETDADGAVLLAMAGSGRVYRARGADNWESLFDFDEQQATTLALRDGRLAFVGTGNVGNGYAVSAEKAADGEFTSEVRDCRFLTTWGNLLWHGTGTVSVSTRTGNTALPDSTWSAWSEPLRTSPGKIASPRGRFIQVRVQLAGSAEPTVQSVQIFYQMQNQKPEVTSVTIGEKPKPAKPEKPKTESTFERKDETREMPDIEAAASAAIAKATGDAKPPEQRPKTATPVKRISWQASDKDGDTLVYRLFYQADGDEAAVPVALEKPLKTTEFSWNTESVPDGWYRVKVVASDEESNPAGEALTGEKTSDLVRVDNGRPEVRQLAFDAAGSALTGSARDALSLIRFLEYSVDGGDWKFFAPKDGVFDDLEESFSVQLPPLATGPHHIAVRATDELGNIGVEKIMVRVK